MVWVRNSVLLLLVVLCSGFGWVTYDQARTLVYHPKFERKPATIMPELVDLQVQEVVITNAQGMRFLAILRNPIMALMCYCNTVIKPAGVTC